ALYEKNVLFCARTTSGIRARNGVCSGPVAAPRPAAILRPSPNPGMGLDPAVCTCPPRPVNSYQFPSQIPRFQPAQENGLVAIVFGPQPFPENLPGTGYHPGRPSGNAGGYCGLGTPRGQDYHADSEGGQGKGMVRADGQGGAGQGRRRW